ncbi:hypothetical protein BUALT_Bualt11G0033600 [Buddleja alternifolia]|uniref:Uncharacterized protein n=1 Tax=Buddleja alternifolia TaxID=168488 RepID=A0AAV6WT06_9LAMI|nr:hypothetical protein BUALT_Bualt11G0033600 [Buddleja alternifolia]
MAPLTVTKVLLVFLVAFCAFPMILSARISIYKESMNSSHTLLCKLGLDLSKTELLPKNAAMGVGSSLREVPRGPDSDPHQHYHSPVNVEDSGERRRELSSETLPEAAADLKLK